MVKVLFYHCVDLFKESFNFSYDRDGIRTVYPGLASLYIKTYFEINYPDLADQVEWVLPIQIEVSNEELVEIINREKPDLFCTGHYVWNHDKIMEQLKYARSRISDKTKIVVGGPQIDVSQNPNFFKSYPFVDYAVYASGEVAFSDLLKSTIEGKKLISFNTSNIAWYDKEKDKQIIAEWKYVPQSKISPYLYNEEYFSNIINDIFKRGYQISMPYELTRGCPYSCTFCDWNSGFSNKTTRRKGTFRDEIDLFHKLKIENIMLSDANVGQYEEDIELVEYILEKNIKENAKFKVDGNFSKLKKDNVLKMFHIIGNINTNNKTTKAGLGFMLSVQDIHKEILDNVDRPDIGWDEHLRMAKDLRENFPEIQTKVQLILGLPGQTTKTWRHTVSEVSSHDLVLIPFLHTLIPASPAYMNPEYAKKWNPVYSDAIRYSSDHEFFKATFVESCSSFSKEDLVEMTVTAQFYVTLTHFKFKYPSIKIENERIADAYLYSKHYQRLYNNLYTNWRELNNYYYTLNFDFEEGVFSACEFSYEAARWALSENFKKLILGNIDKEESRKLMKIFINERVTREEVVWS